MNKFDYNKLTPFKWFVLENFPFIEADFDALTEWQLFCKLGKEINKIINSENTLGEQTENLTNAFIALQNYVNNYFDNLDIQNEVNNKLNEMAEDGTLARIINQEIFGNINSQINTLTNEVTTINNKLNNRQIENEITSCYYGSYAHGKTNYQGLCIDNNNNMYIYSAVNYPIGKIDVYNLSTGTLINTYNNIQGYHGNSLVFKDNKIYIATTKNDNQEALNSDIAVFDIATATTTFLHVFNNVAEYVWGLTKYKDKILVGLGNTNDNFENILLYTLDSNNNIEKINITNTKNIYTNYTWHQDICYNNEHLYIMCSENNQLLDLLENNNTFNLECILNIPVTDSFGMLCGELEGIDLINGFGNGTMLKYSKWYDPEIDDFVMIFDLINPQFGFKENTINTWLPNIQLSNLTYLNYNNNTIFKYGFNNNNGFMSLTQFMLFKKYNKLGVDVINCIISSVKENANMIVRNLNNLYLSIDTDNIVIKSLKLIQCNNISCTFRNRTVTISEITVDNCTNIKFNNVITNKILFQYSLVYLNNFTINAIENNYLKILQSTVYCGFTINDNNKTLAQNSVEQYSTLYQCPASSATVINRNKLQISASCSIIKTSI